MSEAEKELQKQIDDAYASGEDASRLNRALRDENKRTAHSRNR